MLVEVLVAVGQRLPCLFLGEAVAMKYASISSEDTSSLDKLAFK